MDGGALRDYCGAFAVVVEGEGGGAGVAVGGRSCVLVVGFAAGYVVGRGGGRGYYTGICF